MITTALLSLALWAMPAHAATLDGVTVPDTITLGGQSLVLNGMGLREKFFFDIYVGSLYLPARTTDWKSAIEQDVPKRMQMTFVYSSVTKDQIVDAYKEDVAKQPNAAALADRYEKLYAMMEDVKKGDVIQMDYVPGQGTTITVKGKVKGTIPGKDFMESLFSIYIGPHPPTTALKKGLMGGND